MALMHSPAASQVRFVLVEPQEPRNVGAVCRAMKTMGFRTLYVVGAANLDREQAAVSAVHAVDVLQAAEFCGTLEDALRGAVLAAGVTRRRGRRRKYFAVDPEGLAQRVASLGGGACAVVFGNEAAGLSDRQLRLCHLAVQIPTAPEFPSLNLSHAVQVIAYALFRRPGPGCGAFQPIGAQELEQLVVGIIGALGGLGLLRRGDPEEQGVFWRDILCRAALEHREAERLSEIFDKIRGAFAGRKIDS